MQNTEQEYKEQIKELEQQIRLLKEQVDFLTRKLYGTRSEKTSTLEIEGQMSLLMRSNPALIPIHPNRILLKWKNISVKGSMPASGRNWSKTFPTARYSMPWMNGNRSAKNVEVPW